MARTKKTGMYGMWSRKSKRFIFGIQEPTKNRAIKALEREIGRVNPHYFYPKAVVEGHDNQLRNGLGKEFKRSEGD